jgi:hypothetical protein
MELNTKHQTPNTNETPILQTPTGAPQDRAARFMTGI